MSVSRTAPPVPPTTGWSIIMDYLVPPLVIPVVIAIAVFLFALIHGPVV